MDKANEYAETCFKLACQIIGFFENDGLRSDVCIRYNRKGGAYVSIDPDNIDQIILYNHEIKETEDRGALSYFLQLALSDKSFFPTKF